MCTFVFASVCKCELYTVDTETFVEELFRGLNFQKIKFLWMVAPQNFEPNKDFVVKNFYKINAQWPCKAVTQYLKAVDTTYTRTFGEWQLVKTNLWWNSWVHARTMQVIFMTEMPLLLNNQWLFAMEDIARLCSFSEDRWNRLLHCDWKTVGKIARQAMDITLLYSLKIFWQASKATDFSCNLPYHSSSIFCHTNYLLI